MVPALDERSPRSPQGNTPLAAYWYVLLKRRWTIVAAVRHCLPSPLPFFFRTTPIYEATARLEIEPETPQLQSSSDVYQKTDADDVFLQTQIQVLRVKAWRGKPSNSSTWRTISAA